jgi:hypothetical protein
MDAKVLYGHAFLLQTEHLESLSVKAPLRDIDCVLRHLISIWDALLAQRTDDGPITRLILYGFELDGRL